MTDASTSTFPPLVVGTDREAVKKAFRIPLASMTLFIVVIAFVAVLLASLTASVSGVGAGILTSLPFLISLTFMTYTAVRTAGAAAERAAAGTVLTVDAAGLASNTPQGLVVLPWQAISHVEVQKRGGHQIAVFRLMPGVTPDGPGVHTTVKPNVFGILAKKGFRIGAGGIDVPLQTVLDATAAFTAGRLVAR
ncbi:hypothetical protein C5E11_13355 [Clavibacter michiganensis]|nr:hypothetical protein [Clavibacter michiganensis]PPF61861.1 hypothetical protein C5E11_13355 [Clavibacter michiganensis]